MKMFVLYLPAQDVMEKNRLYERNGDSPKEMH